MVPHFFCGGTSGVFADKLGGKKGCIIASFIGGIFLAFYPQCCYLHWEISVLKTVPLQTLTSLYGGIVIGEAFTHFGQIAVYIICAVMSLVLLIPFAFKSIKVVGNTMSYEELTKKKIMLTSKHNINVKY